MLSLALSVLLIWQVAAYTIDDCPASIPRDVFLQLKGNSCFEFVFYDKKEYEPASQYCRSQGGTLALVQSQDTQDYLYGEMKNTYNVTDDTHYIWIGLNDMGQEGNLTWEDGAPLDYANWPFGGPTHYFGHYADIDDCVAISSVTGLWDDWHCHDPPNDPFFNAYHYFICQYQLDKMTQPVTGAGPLPTTTDTVTAPSPPVPATTDASLV